MRACSMPHTVLGIFLKMSHLILTVTFRDVIIVFIFHLKDPKLRQVKHTQSQTAGKQQSWNLYPGLSVSTAVVLPSAPTPG